MKKKVRLPASSFPDWDNYIQTAIGSDFVDQCRSSCHGAFQNQREVLTSLFSMLKPERIGCLGSGCLNDIPIEHFLRQGSEVFLIDWIPRISEEGFKSRIIQSDRGKFSCFLCSPPCNPEKLCDSWTGNILAGHEVCGNFRLAEGITPRCGNFRPGIEPHFIAADVTLGRGSALARRAGKLVASSGSPVQAIRKAMEEARRCEAVKYPIELEDGSLDLVTSSMVLSQFDHEPITFLSGLLRSRFGDRLFSQEDRINRLLNDLRSEVFRVQAEGHIKELYRLVEKERGRVYFSVELFRTVEGREDYFIVEEIPRAMEILGGYFLFDFETIPPEHTLKPVPIGEGTSILQNYLLVPKPALEISTV